MTDNSSMTGSTVSAAIDGLMAVYTRATGTRENSMELGHTIATKKTNRQRKVFGRMESVSNGWSKTS